MEFLPYGVGVDRVEEEHPSIMRCPLVVTGSVSDIRSILRKFWHYRIWYHLQGEKGRMSPAAPGGIQEGIQDAFQALESSDPDFVRGITSVSLFFPKALEPAVIKQLAKFGPPIYVQSEPARRRARKSIPIRSKEGREVSLPILEEGLDIETEGDSTNFLVFNNLVEPAWGIRVPEGTAAVSYSEQAVQLLDSNQVAESTAWKRVRAWLRSRGLSVCEAQYPNGEDRFPDFLAWIAGREFDVEITSAPNIGRWRIDFDFRRLEKKIQEVAKQPGELRSEVAQEIERGVKRKAARVEERPCILVMTNWSSYSFSDSSLWTDMDLAEFEAILLIEQEEVHCVHSKVAWD